MTAKRGFTLKQLEPQYCEDCSERLEPGETLLCTYCARQEAERIKGGTSQTLTSDPDDDLPF